MYYDTTKTTRVKAAAKDVGSVLVIGYCLFLLQVLAVGFAGSF